MPVSWLSEPHAHKTALFEAVSKVDAGGRKLPTWKMSFRDFPEMRDRTAECYARAKKQPSRAIGRFLKRTFIRGRYNWARRYFLKHPEQLALCWQGLTGTRRAFMMGAQDAGAATLFAELAPLPGFKTLDPIGVNAESNIPQNPSTYGNVAPDAALLSDIRDRLTSRPSQRSDVGQAGALPDEVSNFLFVPLQVPDDSQMILFADWVGSMVGFVERIAVAAQSLPDGWHLRLKEHPSSKIRLTDTIERAIADGARMVLDNDTDSFEQLRASKGVLTVNSSMGLQAMLFDKPVYTTGRTFYALPGLTSHAHGPKELADLLANADKTTFNQEFRARFLTWLATEYYIRETDTGYDLDHISRKLAEARA